MMTFGELDAHLADLLGSNYSVSVELVSSENKYPKCEHAPKIKRTLSWKIWSSRDGKFFEAPAAEEALKMLKEFNRPPSGEATPEAVKAVDAERVEAE